VDQTAKLQDYLNAVGFFRTAFALVFALALTEALKQFVAEHPKQSGNAGATQPDQTHALIHWDRFPALLSFVFLLVPFFQGTVRYFYLTYESKTQPFATYDQYLVIDGLAFLIEAALFFAMSRAITTTRWRALYSCIFCLLIVDSGWSWIEYRHGALPSPDWIKLNIGLAVVLVALLFFIRVYDGRRMWLAVGLGTVAIIIRTFLDYRWSWEFYFPGA
jgi:hypothetical protein